MAKLLTVVGATGNQGLSLINAALDDGTYRVRGVTRNPHSPKAAALTQRGVEMVQADVNDEASLMRAFQGSHAIFAMTAFLGLFVAHGPEKAAEIEAAQGINMARAAAKTATLEHYVWSTLPNIAKVTQGKWHIPHFVGKNMVDDHIKQDTTLFPKTSFLWIGYFATNMKHPVFTPNFVKSAGAYILLSPARPELPIKTIGDPSRNIGTFALATLKQPQRTLPGRFVLAHAADTTNGQLLADFTAVTGKPSKYVQTSLADFSAIWPGFGLEMGAMMAAWNELDERSWSGEDNIVTRTDLGLDHIQFASVQDAYKTMDWNALL